MFFLIMVSLLLCSPITVDAATIFEWDRNVEVDLDHHETLAVLLVWGVL